MIKTNWLEKWARTKYLDTQTFSIPGEPDWKPFIEDLNLKRDVIRQRAERKAESLGHVLFPWTCMNSTLCRKCGSTVYLHNIHGITASADMDGRAITDPCIVTFDNSYEFEKFEHQDYHGDTVI